MTSGGYTLDEVKRMHGLDRPRLNSYLPPCKSAATYDGSEAPSCRPVCRECQRRSSGCDDY